MVSGTALRSRPSEVLPVAASPGPGSRDAVVLIATVATGVAAVLAFGALGALAMIGPLRRSRRRRAATCRVCSRNQRVWLAATVALALLSLVGAGLRVAPGGAAAPACAVTTISGGVPSEPARAKTPQLEGRSASALRSLLTAPASGLAIGYSRWRGQSMCDLKDPAMTLTFMPKARNLTGGTIGDVFITPWRPDLDSWQTEALARHESRHSDQWAVATAVGGMTLLPVAYLVDDSLYPGELNHFEQSAGLAAGGYPRVPSPAPGPRPVAVAIWALLACLFLRSHLRQLTRALAGRPLQRSAHRCARHNTRTSHPAS